MYINVYKCVSMYKIEILYIYLLIIINNIYILLIMNSKSGIVFDVVKTDMLKSLLYIHSSQSPSDILSCEMCEWIVNLPFKVLDLGYIKENCIMCMEKRPKIT